MLITINRVNNGYLVNSKAPEGVYSNSQDPKVRESQNAGLDDFFGNFVFTDIKDVHVFMDNVDRKVEELLKL